MRVQARRKRRKDLKRGVVVFDDSKARVVAVVRADAPRDEHGRGSRSPPLAFGFVSEHPELVGVPMPKHLVFESK